MSSGSLTRIFQDANSNRLAWKCPSPGDKPRLQMLNLNKTIGIVYQKYWTFFCSKWWRNFDDTMLAKWSNLKSHHLVPTLSSGFFMVQSKPILNALSQPPNRWISIFPIWVYDASPNRKPQNFSRLHCCTVKKWVDWAIGWPSTVPWRIRNKKKLSGKEKPMASWNWRLVLLTIMPWAKN